MRCELSRSEVEEKGLVGWWLASEDAGFGFADGDEIFPSFTGGKCGSKEVLEILAGD